MWDEFEDSGVKCPYCGYISEETPDRSTIWQCNECKREFDVEVEYSVICYSTKLETAIEGWQNQLACWKNPKPKDLDCAERIIEGYERELQKLKDRLAANLKEIEESENN